MTTTTMTTTPTHTPGPWRSNGPQVCANGDWCLTVCALPRGGAGDAAKTDKEADANARLIASAPDLLAALKFLAVRTNGKNQFMSDDPMHKAKAEFDEAMNMIRAAISKAEGRA